MLAENLPEASFLGLDLSEGMIKVAREVAAVAGIRYGIKMLKMILVTLKFIHLNLEYTRRLLTIYC